VLPWLQYFPHHCGIWDFRRFISINFLIQSPADFHVTRRNDWMSSR